MANQQHRPGGSRPGPEVFRRRRIVAGVGLLVVIALIVWAVVAVAGLFAGGSDPEAGSSTQPTSAGSSQPGSGPEAGASRGPDGGASASAGTSGNADDGGSAGGGADGPACTPEDIAVTAETDQQSYGPDQDPVLEMTIANEGATACSLNVGTKEQEFNVVSGEDRIFSTTDCLEDATDATMTLKPGQKETARFTWERVRSAPGCKTVPAKPRPGTYVFSAKLGESASNRATFSLQ